MMTYQEFMAGVQAGINKAIAERDAARKKVNHAERRVTEAYDAAMARRQVWLDSHENGPS